MQTTRKICTCRLVLECSSAHECHSSFGAIFRLATGGGNTLSGIHTCAQSREVLGRDRLQQQRQWGHPMHIVAVSNFLWLLFEVHVERQVAPMGLGGNLLQLWHLCDPNPARCRQELKVEDMLPFGDSHRILCTFSDVTHVSNTSPATCTVSALFVTTKCQQL